MSHTFTLTPEEFTLVKYDAAELLVIAEDAATRVGVPDGVSITIDVDEALPGPLIASAAEVADGNLAFWFSGGCFEDPKRQSMLEPEMSRTELVQALLDDWQFPATDPEVRSRYEEQLAQLGPAALHRRLAEVDGEAAEHILDTDGRRIVRALEVVEITGRPFSASAPQIGEPRWNTTIIALDRDTADLDERIARRTSAMFSGGLVDEVRALLDVGLREGVTAARAIGYAQTIAALDGEYDLARAEELTFIGTRRYVRRQRSWFRRDPRVKWLDASAPDVLGQALLAAGRGGGSAR